MKRPAAPDRVVGLIGLGLMGTALAERMLSARFEVMGFDVKPARRRALRKLGGQPASSAAEVAVNCRRIVFSLPTTDVVAAVIRKMGADLRAGSILIDTTTGEPEQSALIGSLLAERKIRYLDATILGSSADTRTGKVIVMAGGERRTLTACRDVFDCFAKRVFHVGPCGAGACLKLVVNLVLGLNRAVLAEGLAFAHAAGVAPELALEILKSGAASSHVMEAKGEKMLRGEFAPQAKLSQHLKDVRLILAAGRRAGAKLPFTKLHRQLLLQLEAAGLGELDNCAIIKAFE